MVTRATAVLPAWIESWLAANNTNAPTYPHRPGRSCVLY